MSLHGALTPPSEFDWNAFASQEKSLCFTLGFQKRLIHVVTDVKGVFITALFTALVGGIYAVIILIVNPSFTKKFIHKGLQPLKFFIYKESIPIPETKVEKAPKLCYGVAIAIGTLIYLSLKTAGFKIFY